ncbi:MAG: transporter substrate-binding domain-containing protein [Spirochaetaceae bacterium]|jgi:ABC-type amino acid transport substrate-binding protein|nr:transporter substrate-binding domain-containing protein [Spirochaetaceae bacterium]
MNKRKKILIFSLIFVLAAALGNVWGGGGKQSTGDYRDKLLRPDRLVIGTSPDYPPYESLDGDRLVGFDIEMMEAVAASMGLEIDWNQMEFDSILIALQAGQIDAGVSGFTYTKEREDAGTLFSAPYLKSAQVAFVRKDSDIRSAEDFPGRHFYAGLGTTGEAAIKEIDGVRISNTLDYQIAFELLKQGQLDGVVCDVAVGEGYVRSMDLRKIEPPLIDEENHVVFRRGNEAVRDAFNRALDTFMKTGDYTKLRMKFGL